MFLGLRGGSTAGLSFPHHPRISVRRMGDSEPGIRQKVHYLRFCCWIIWTVICWRPQWIYASDALSSPAAVVLSAFKQLRILYHEHDTPAEKNSDASPASVFMKLILRARRTLAQRAEICVLPNEQRRSAFTADTHRRGDSFCVWNCPSRADAEPAVSVPHDRSVVIFFHGSIVPERLPIALIRALLDCPSSITFRFAGYETNGHVGYVRELLKEAERIGLGERVTYLGAMPRKLLLAECRRADVGVAFMPLGTTDQSMTTMVGASNKPFDYLACGLTLLVSDLRDWNETFVAPGYARACNPHDAASIAAELRWLAENPEHRQQMGERGRRRVLDDWNYEARFQPVLDYIAATGNG
jgi:glycosyltransferase involved in cell wall biosynthesis